LACSALSAEEVFYVTFRLPHSEESFENIKHYYIIDPHTNILKYAINFFQSLAVYIRTRPEIIITTGAGVAVSMCLIGKAFGSNVLFIETAARIQTPSRTGKLLYKIADKTVVQWEELLEHYPDAEHGGLLV
jgi:UDP-N-acetylglucosamine:LPS N-acetylglucosamine transferase